MSPRPFPRNCLSYFHEQSTALLINRWREKYLARSLDYSISYTTECVIITRYDEIATTAK